MRQGRQEPEVDWRLPIEADTRASMFRTRVTAVLVEARHLDFPAQSTAAGARWCARPQQQVRQARSSWLSGV